MQFEEHNTEDGPFTLLDGSTVSVPMMAQTELFRYAEEDGYQALAMGYLGANLSMLFILPAEGDFEGFESSLSTETLDKILGDLERQPVSLFLPKFTFESEFGLSQTLADMGMASAFGSEADFSGMTGSRDLFISDVIHKAFIAVDEEGTEAAAATAVVMTESAAPIFENPSIMRLDRPFFFLIRDDTTGSILFAGRVLNPEG
jgi:serpin B